MKTVFLAIFTVSILAIIPLSVNAEIPELSDVTLQSQEITIEFGELEIISKGNDVTVNNTIEKVRMGNIIFDDTYIKTYNYSFSIKDLDNGLVMYAVGDTNTGYPYDYDVTIYYQGEKFETFLDLQPEPIEESKVIVEEQVEVYEPELKVIVERDLRTYWRDTFNFEVIVFDANEAPSTLNKDVFAGRFDGAKVTVLLSIGDDTIAQYTGQTENGVFDGLHYFEENVSIPGQYTFDVIVSYEDNIISESIPFFVVGTVTPDSDD